jgi:glycerol-1-phosphate dehydrogenase [NAD(P)+]
MSHVVRGTEYFDLPYDLLMRDEDDLVAMAGDLVKGDLDAMLSLVDTLVLAGFGMTAVKTSAPGSQGEHLISHYSDMRAGGHGPNSAFHGEQIAVTTLTMARLQDYMLSRPAPRVEARLPSRSEIVARFGEQIGAKCWDEVFQKASDTDEVNHRLAEVWPELQERLAKVVRSPASIAKTLTQAGAPTDPAEIGWSRDYYTSAVRHAREIRARYTFLDLAAESGIMDAEIENIV